MNKNTYLYYYRSIHKSNKQTNKISCRCADNNLYTHLWNPLLSAHLLFSAYLYRCSGLMIKIPTILPYHHT